MPPAFLLLAQESTNTGGESERAITLDFGPSKARLSRRDGTRCDGSPLPAPTLRHATRRGTGASLSLSSAVSQGTMRVAQRRPRGRARGPRLRERGLSRSSRLTPRRADPTRAAAYLRLGSKSDSPQQTLAALTRVVLAKSSLLKKSPARLRWGAGGFEESRMKGAERDKRLS